MSRCWNKVCEVFAVAIILSVISCTSVPDYESIDEVFQYQVMFTIATAEAHENSGGAQHNSQSKAQLSSKFELQNHSEQVVNRIVKFHRLKKVAQWPLRALGVEAVVAEFSSDRPIHEVIGALRADDDIESVQAVNTYKLLSYNDPYFDLQNAVPPQDLAQVHSVVTGKNVRVAVVDTGVDRKHPELMNRITYSRNFVVHDGDNFDSDEHGTTVAGVIGAAANNDLGIVGVAPEADLMIFKACAHDALTSRASCDSFSLTKALSEVIRQRPDVLNLSLAGVRNPLLERLILSAISKGIIVVASVDHHNRENTFPASIPGVIAVSSAFQFDHDWMPSRGVIAPGIEMLTTTPGATYAFRSGSSMSTALVTGVAALMKEKNSQLTASELSQQLHATAQNSLRQVPIVDVCSAVSASVVEKNIVKSLVPKPLIECAKGLILFEDSLGKLTTN